MARLQSYFVTTFCFIIFFSNCVDCNDSRRKSNLLDLRRISHEIFSKNDLGGSNAIIETMSKHNWTENHECLVELLAIKNGIDNFEEWGLERMYKCLLFHLNKCFSFIVFFHITEWCTTLESTKAISSNATVYSESIVCLIALLSCFLRILLCTNEITIGTKLMELKRTLIVKLSVGHSGQHTLCVTKQLRATV